ncbi:unnamed protein product [Protopolystoma xenopodis]|uniref:Uncharacterized protein n=1 Tax=Protopolystoma xenopodis TaxID=117903 RepID=A0A3S5C1R0_9PLAT|nr:unnamed protein product [Protopolystoma xenopodis]
MPSKRIEQVKPPSLPQRPPAGPATCHMLQSRPFRVIVSKFSCHSIILPGTDDGDFRSYLKSTDYEYK